MWLRLIKLKILCHQVNLYWFGCPWNDHKHDDVIKWKHFPRYWPFVWGIHRFLVNSPHKGQWRGALMFSLICVWINGWVNNRGAGDLRRYRAHYDVTVMVNAQLSCPLEVVWQHQDITWTNVDFLSGGFLLINRFLGNVFVITSIVFSNTVQWYADDFLSNCFLVNAEVPHWL